MDLFPNLSTLLNSNSITQNYNHVQTIAKNTPIFDLASTYNLIGTIINIINSNNIVVRIDDIEQINKIDIWSEHANCLSFDAVYSNPYNIKVNINSKVLVSCLCTETNIILSNNKIISLYDIN